MGFRRSVETSSWRYAFGSAQSHSVMTTLRSTPCGRGGVGGAAPAAVPAVPAADNASAGLAAGLLQVAVHLGAAFSRLGHHHPRALVDTEQCQGFWNFPGHLIHR